MDIEKFGYTAPWKYPKEQAPRSILGYLALDKYYKFYPLDKTGKLSKSPIRASFYDEGAEELTRGIVAKHGCKPVKNLDKIQPNIRLICYPNKGILEVLYGLDILDNSYLPKEQVGELLKVIEDRNIKTTKKSKAVEQLFSPS
jgi:hypothetical protein